ncbi:MAG: hypothetical protein JWM47_2842, partial [Acidimicrobiales bacterium]|nr:hypothetical protein [Acidimicrobiales bacterium]
MTELIETRYIRVELTPATAAAYDRMVDGGLGHEDVIGAAERAMAVVLVVDAGIDIAAAPVDTPAFTTHQTVKLQGRALQAFFSDYNHGSTGPGGPDNAARLAVRATGHPAKFMMLPTSQAREHGLDLAATPELLTWARTSPARRSTTVELELDALAAEIEEARGPDPTGTRVPDLEPSYLDPALER